MMYPPFFGSARLGERLGPRGSAKRWVAGTIIADVCAFTAGCLGVAAAGGSWASCVGFGVAFVVLETMFMIGLGAWVRRRDHRGQRHVE
jgi:hypothetical protein